MRVGVGGGWGLGVHLAFGYGVIVVFFNGLYDFRFLFAYMYFFCMRGFCLVCTLLGVALLTIREGNGSVIIYCVSGRLDNEL